MAPDTPVLQLLTNMANAFPPPWLLVPSQAVGTAHAVIHCLSMSQMPVALVYNHYHGARLLRALPQPRFQHLRPVLITVLRRTNQLHTRADILPNSQIVCKPWIIAMMRGTRLVHFLFQNPLHELRDSQIDVHVSNHQSLRKPDGEKITGIHKRAPPNEPRGFLISICARGVGKRPSKQDFEAATQQRPV